MFRSERGGKGREGKSKDGKMQLFLTGQTVSVERLETYVASGNLEFRFFSPFVNCYRTRLAPVVLIAALPPISPHLLASTSRCSRPG